ncbi:MAG TPA: methyltransferase [Limnochordia bacterium]|nr:methyltransferase [Limnochordia bacterium]
MFKTDFKLFSPLDLDAGTAAMLSRVEFTEGQRVLDLGCGYGVVGIVAAKIVGEQNVVMIDHDPLAVQLARENAALNEVPRVHIYESDGFTSFSEAGFDLILSNPPYHTDFSVPKAFIEKGFNRLVMGGRMYMVTKRHKWYKNKLVAIFGGVQIREVDGYYVFMAEKRSTQYAKKRGK